MSEALVAGLLAGYAIAIPVGPIGALIVSLTARTGLRVGAAGALGVASADAIYAAAAVLGGAALVRLVEPVAGPMRWVAAVVLAVLAAWTAVGAVRHHRRPVAAARTGRGLGTPPRAYLGLLGLTLLNPMTIVYFSALVLGRRAADGLEPAGEVIFVVAAALASASWQLLLAGGGSLVGRVLTGRRGRLGTALVSSAVIAAFAGWLLLQR